MSTAGLVVSVIMPTYNRAGLLPRAVKSVLAQSYPNIELLVIDDGSSDHTEHVVKELVEMDDRIKYHRVPHGGAAKARNWGISFASGHYVAFQDTDDEWHNNFLQRLLVEVGPDSNKFAFCSHNLVSVDGARSRVPLGHVGRPTESLRFGNFISTQTALLPRQFFADGVLFDESLQRFQDWDLWLQLIEQRRLLRIAHVDEVLATLYRQPDSISEGSRKLRFQSLLRIMRRHWRTIWSNPLAGARLLTRIMLPRFRYGTARRQA